MTEAQKAKATLEKLQPEYETLKASYQAVLMRGAFEKTARALKLEFASETAMETAYKLLDKDTVGEDGEGMKDAVATLQKEHAYLFGKGAQPPTTDAQQKGRTSGELTSAQVLAQKRAKYGAPL